MNNLCVCVGMYILKYIKYTVIFKSVQNFSVKDFENLWFFSLGIKDQKLLTLCCRYKELQKQICHSDNAGFSTSCFSTKSVTNLNT